MQTATKMRQELPSLVSPENWCYDLVKLADTVNLLYTSLQTIADPMAEIPKAVVRGTDTQLAVYYEDLARNTIEIANGKYDRKSGQG